MALNLGRWIKYAQARLDGALASGNRELDQLEAEREAELADRPWLASDAEHPTLDEARARIEWEAGQQAEDPGTAPAPTPPSSGDAGDAADAAAARIEIDRREREAKARLDAMREELGIEPPTS
jgi:hypothetical protein